MPPESPNILNHIQPIEYDKGKVIFRQGDPSKNQMFFISKGSVVLSETVDGKERAICRIHENNFFGEMALLTGGKRTASAISAVDGVRLISLDSSIIENMIQKNPKFMFRMLLTAASRHYREELNFSKLEYLVKIDPSNLEFADDYENCRIHNLGVISRIYGHLSNYFPPGKFLFRSGEPASEKLWFVLQGKLVLCKTAKDGSESEVRDYHPGDLLDLSSLIGSNPRVFAVKAVDDTAVVTSIDRNLLYRVLTLNPKLFFNVFKTIVYDFTILNHCFKMSKVGESNLSNGVVHVPETEEVRGESGEGLDHLTEEASTAVCEDETSSGSNSEPETVGAPSKENSRV
ncbi:cyclic nucleotide-binding domain-containing protein [Leptospira sp. 201903070]|uniref:Cyclic nucleotide-binding domain-containing protein n=1 Tax=Leptospira ainlahdjerensis TaxID=2810033 RepID=A0ABS2UGM2_9LEPT|nr:cyclic nucleotide-binding domain-containing protein [Leptospira ainlahdjerensis]MBM9579511.1 cyclic nucleotide-binding domain-containing protein [Leptospira ainlahdjerensis]